MTVRYRRHEDLRLTSLEDEGIVLHLGSRKYFSVSETGLFVLQELENQSRSVDELVEALKEQYEVPSADAQLAVREFVEKCVDAKLLKQNPRD